MSSALYNSIYNNVWLNYVYKNYSVHPLELLSFLNQSQYWDKQKMKSHQFLQFQHLVSLSIKNIKFYSRLYNQNILENLHDIDSFELLPIITKKDIQNNDLLNHRFDSKKLSKATTSGSSGDPLVIFLNELAMTYRIAGRYRFYSWWGIKPGDKGIAIWGQKDDISKEKNIKKKIKEFFFLRQFKINIFDLNSKTIKHYYKMVLKIKPSYLYGYTSAIKQFTELIDQNDLNGALLNIKIAIVTSEVLLQEDRTLIGSILNCNVVNEYGAADAGLFAFECPKGGMHVFEESVCLSTNSENEVIATEIFNESMPLINYKVGDKLIFAPGLCECGRTLKLIDSIEGRAGDVIIKPNGEKLSQYFFYYAAKNLDSMGYANGILKYKVIQNGNNFDYFIVKGNNFKEEILEYLLEKMKDTIGKSITVRFHFVEEIPRESSGKLRFFKREI